MMSKSCFQRSSGLCESVLQPVGRHVGLGRRVSHIDRFLLLVLTRYGHAWGSRAPSYMEPPGLLNEKPDGAIIMNFYHVAKFKPAIDVGGGMSDEWWVMVVSSDLENRRRVARILANLGLDPICAASVQQCRETLEKQGVAMIFCERDLVDGNYCDILASTTNGARKMNTRVVVMSSVPNPAEYRDAKRSGVFDVISLSGQPISIEWAIITAKREERSQAIQKQLFHSEITGKVGVEVSRVG